MSGSTSTSASAKSAGSLFRIFVSAVGFIYGTFLLMASIYIGLPDAHNGRIDSMALAIILPALLVLAGAGAGFAAHRKWAYPSLAGNLAAFAIVCSMIPQGLTTAGLPALLALVVPAALSILSTIGIIRQRREAAERRTNAGWTAALLLFAASAAHADGHPVFYIDKGACPFECCTYRDWDAKKEIPLFAKPKAGSSAVGVVQKGARVKAETGEVHTKPGKLAVRRDSALFKRGEILWVYTYLGEGVFKIWHKGKFIEEQINFDYRNPSQDDWGHFEAKPKSAWWVRVRTAAGLQGWTKQVDDFSNKDACG